MKYSAKLKAKGAAGIYASGDTAHTFFNYFKTTVDALEFLDEKGWSLFTIINEVNDFDRITAKVDSVLIYYLRKEKN